MPCLLMMGGFGAPAAFLVERTAASLPFESLALIKLRLTLTFLCLKFYRLIYKALYVYCIFREKENGSAKFCKKKREVGEAREEWKRYKELPQ